jgi:pyridoxamine 5'-phosphate oxidase
MDEQDLDPDPLRQFALWFEQAPEPQPEAVAVATATPEGAPSVRMVLMKGFDERGFVFYTNYDSRKGRELAANPQAALLFHWPGRQVRIEGPVERTPPKESAAYARSRPRGSQLSALASAQSRPVASRAELERRVAELADAHPGELPVHEGWGGFRVAPESYEFWEHRPDRLHDRFRYARDGAGRWRIERLSP